MAARSYRWVFWLLALVGLSADQVSKYSVFTWLYDAEELKGSAEVIPGVFKIDVQYRAEIESGNSPLSWLRTISAKHLPFVNEGALFGTKLLFPDTSNIVFAIVSVLAALGIVYWSSRPAMARDVTLCIALGLILGGTLGNLYDRVVFGGVRDFLHWYKPEWPVFNVADCCLVCGAGLLLFEAFFTKTEAPKSEAAEAAAVSNANAVS
jgi:signal peptidase II